MMNDFNLSRPEKARLDFFNNGIEDTKVFRQEVYDAWKRALNKYHLDPNVSKAKILTSDELEVRRNNNQLLLRVAVPFMELLYGTVKGSGFAIMLADRDGYILKMIGDDSLVMDLMEKTNPLIEGCCRHESVYGNNGIGTPMALGRPVQITTDEHFYRGVYGVTGTGAPLIDVDGNLLGALSMSGSWDKVHLHTLGMVTAASQAIVEQLSLHMINHQLSATKNRLQSILDTFEDGVLLLNSDFEIIDINAAALKILDYKRNEILNHPIMEFINQIDFTKIASNTHDLEATIKAKNKTANFFITVRIVENSTNQKPGLLIIFKEAYRIHKLVNRYIGSSAFFTFEQIIGDSLSLENTKDIAKIAADNSSNVLITGESGTGKELFAQSIHNGSKFADGPFIAVNCGAIPKTLIESELFGYEAGSFTGAKREGNAGKFELANNGTIFLDEIGEMPSEAQVHLLRILQNKEVTRIGGKSPIPLNIRVIAATNVNLENAILEKTFRNDLFYRLNVLSFTIPPLRERENDIFILTDYFIEKMQQQGKPWVKGITPHVAELFKKYSWPGNVRELENVIERACLLTQGSYITVEAIPQSMLRAIETLGSQAADRSSELALTDILAQENTSFDDAEKAVILKHLKAFDSNVKKTAESCGISRRTLYRKLEKYAIDYRNLK